MRNKSEKELSNKNSKQGEYNDLFFGTLKIYHLNLYRLHKENFQMSIFTVLVQNLKMPGQIFRF